MLALDAILEDGTGAAACYSLCIAGFQLKHLSPSSVGHPKENVNHLRSTILKKKDVTWLVQTLCCLVQCMHAKHFTPQKKEQKKESVF